MYDENGMEVQNGKDYNEILSDGEDYDEIPSGVDGNGNFSDIERVCKDCGCTFVFSAGEQEFYKRHDLSNPPGRCMGCRNKRKSDSGRNGHQGNQEKHKTVCSNCGEVAIVNFVPTPGREVLCSRCFAEKRGGMGYSSKNQDTGYSR